MPGTAPPRRWNIALVSELAGPPDEGMRVWLRGYAGAMRSAGHSVVEVVLRGRASRAAADPRNLARLRASRPDVIQYVPYSGLTPAALARLRILGLAAPAATRAIAVLQSGRTGLGAPPGLSADVALFASERLRRATGRIARTSAVVYPVVDTSRFATASPDRAAFRRSVGIGDDVPMALHVGHIKPSRGLATLESLAQRDGLEVLLVASTSTAADPEVRRSLEARGVKVIRRYVADIEAAYHAADVYVFPVEDPLGSIEVPLSVVEAVASGLPVVTTPFGALPELFSAHAGVTFTRPERFPDTVAAALAGERARDRADLGAFSTSRFVAGVEEALGRPASRAKMIVLAGVDGAGKTTQVRLLRDHLERRGVAVETRWCRWDPLLARPAVALLGVLSRRRPAPAGADAARAAARRSIRARLLERRLVRSAWRALIVVDYALRLAPVVRRARRAGDVVLLDRYWQDVMVDFSYGGALHEPPRLLRRLLPDADRMVVLDLPDAVAMQRDAETPDLAYLAERRRLYRESARRYGGIVVDASPPADAVSRSLVRAVEEIVGGP